MTREAELETPSTWLKTAFQATIKKSPKNECVRLHTRNGHEEIQYSLETSRAVDMEFTNLMTCDRT